jgi:hypothetical protein
VPPLGRRRRLGRGPRVHDLGQDSHVAQ